MSIFNLIGIPKVLLLVDDDETSLYVNQRLLKSICPGVVILNARNGQEALNIMHETCGKIYCPELIFLDINMPIMDGFGFLEEFKKVADCHSSSLNIILLSSSNYPLDLEKAKKYPIVDFVQKPLTKEKLLNFL